MKKFSLAALFAFANSNAASTFWVCAVPQNINLDRADFEALAWTQVGSVGSRGETGNNTNVLTYPTWDDTVTQKAKGLTDAGSPQLEVARLPNDAGQQILRDAGVVGNNNNYAFREVRADGALGGVGTIRYNRGLVGGPVSPGGRNEDFDIEIFTLMMQQQEIVVNPTTAGNAPAMTAAPAITGTAEVGEELTCSNGTFTGDAVITYAFQWFAAGLAIAGATTNTFTVTSAELGKVLFCRVYASNSVGGAAGYSAPTAAITNP